MCCDSWRREDPVELERGLGIALQAIQERRPSSRNDGGVLWVFSTAAHQAPPSLGFSRQEHWSGLPFPSPMCESEKPPPGADPHCERNPTPPRTARFRPGPAGLPVGSQQYWRRPGAQQQITPSLLPPPSQTPLANSCQEEKFSIHPCGVAMATPSHLIPLGTLCKSPFAPQQAVKVPLPLQRQLVKFWGSPCKVMLQMKHWLLARNFKDGALWETWGAGRGKQDVRVFLNRLTVGRNSLILPSPPSSHL